MKTLITCITAKQLEPGVYNALYNQDDPDDKTVLISLKKPQVQNENPYFFKAINCAIHRNEVRRLLVASDSNLFFWVDSDVVIPSHALRALKSANKAIIGGWYPIVDTHLWAAGYEEQDKFYNYERVEPGILEVKMVGLGCILMTRHVLESLEFMPGHDKLVISGTHKKMSYAGTSYEFCRQAKEKDYSSFINGNVVCQHLKRKG